MAGVGVRSATAGLGSRASSRSQLPHDHVHRLGPSLLARSLWGSRVQYSGCTNPAPGTACRSGSPCTGALASMAASPGSRIYASRATSTVRAVQALVSQADAPEAPALPFWLAGIQPGWLLQSVSMLEASGQKTGDQPLTAEPVFMEVLTQWDNANQACEVGWRGRRLKLEWRGGQTLHVTHQGTYPAPSAPMLASFPGWGTTLATLDISTQPQLQAWELQLADTSVASSWQQFEVQVQAQPRLWCDGYGPGQAPFVGLEYQLQSAGELLALLSGARGLVMVQLHCGWDKELAQPVFNPFVTTLMARAAASPDLAITMSSIKGGMGLTALISARKGPWLPWAENMASFGAQAALVAGSPFYQMLIGRMLGYKEKNILGYIQAQTGAAPNPAVIAAVEAELRTISPKAPTLPWNASSRGSRKKIKQ